MLKIDLKEISCNNERRRLNYQKNLGSEQHNKRKQKMQHYSQKRRKIAKANLKIKQFKLLIKEGPYYICVLCHRCFYRRSVLIFDSRKYNGELDKKFLVKSFDALFYICKTCHKKYVKSSMPCQAVSNKLELHNLSTEFESIRKLENVLIAKRILFKNVVIMPCGKWKKLQELFVTYQ